MADGAIIAALEALATEVEALSELVGSVRTDVQSVILTETKLVASHAVMAEALSKLIAEAIEDRKRFFDLAAGAVAPPGAPDPP